MTRRRRTMKEAELVKLLLADIIQDTFDKNGQLITHETLAKRHMMRNGSVTAAEDVALYGGPAVVYLRNEKNYAIVPVTHSFHDLDREDPEDDQAVVNAVAGLGTGGPRIGWYHPTDEDDWLWVYYIGHLARAGVSAIYHAGKQMTDNPSLQSAAGMEKIAARATKRIPLPPGQGEVKVLEARARS